MRHILTTLFSASFLLLAACAPGSLNGANPSGQDNRTRVSSQDLIGFTPRPGGLLELPINEMPDLSGTWSGEASFLVTHRIGTATLNLHRVKNHYQGTLRYNVTHSSQGLPDLSGTFSVREGIILQNEDGKAELITLLEAQGTHSDWVADNNLYFASFEIRSRSGDVARLVLADGFPIRTDEELRTIDRGGNLPEARLRFRFWN